MEINLPSALPKGSAPQNAQCQLTPIALGKYKYSSGELTFYVTQLIEFFNH